MLCVRTTQEIIKNVKFMIRFIVRVNITPMHTVWKRTMIIQNVQITSSAKVPTAE